MGRAVEVAGGVGAGRGSGSAGRSRRGPRGRRSPARPSPRRPAGGRSGPCSPSRPGGRPRAEGEAEGPAFERVVGQGRRAVDVDGVDLGGLDPGGAGPARSPGPGRSGRGRGPSRGRRRTRAPLRRARHKGPRAPRARAWSSRSRTRPPPPSPTRKPDRSRSHGRTARLGSSLDPGQGLHPPERRQQDRLERGVRPAGEGEVAGPSADQVGRPGAPRPGPSRTPRSAPGKAPGTRTGRQQATPPNSATTASRPGRGSHRRIPPDRIISRARPRLRTPPCSARSGARPPDPGRAPSPGDEPGVARHRLVGRRGPGLESAGSESARHRATGPVDREPGVARLEARAGRADEPRIPRHGAGRPTSRIRSSPRLVTRPTPVMTTVWVVAGGVFVVAWRG